MTGSLRDRKGFRWLEVHRTGRNSDFKKFTGQEGVHTSGSSQDRKAFTWQEGDLRIWRHSHNWKFMWQEGELSVLAWKSEFKMSPALLSLGPLSLELGWPVYPASLSSFFVRPNFLLLWGVCHTFRVSLRPHFNKIHLGRVSPNSMHFKRSELEFQQINRVWYNHVTTQKF